MLLQIKNEKVSNVATIPEAAGILSLLIDKKGAIYIGTGGDKGSILKIDKPGAKPQTIFTAEGVQYVWGMAQTADGNLYVANTEFIGGTQVGDVLRFNGTTGAFIDDFVKPGSGNLVTAYGLAFRPAFPAASGVKPCLINVYLRTASLGTSSKRPRKS